MTNSITPTAHSSLVGGSTAARRVRNQGLLPEERQRKLQLVRDPAYLRRILLYDPSTGRLTWRERGPELFDCEDRYVQQVMKGWNSRYAGKPALVQTGTNNRYLQGLIGGVGVMSHRAAWMIYHGTPIPNGLQIDHINGDVTDNRIGNLRLATPQQNTFNSPGQPNSASRYKGVSWLSKAGRWRASVKVKGRFKELGLYATQEEAHSAYMAATEKLHGDFAYAKRPQQEKRSTNR